MPVSFSRVAALVVAAVPALPVVRVALHPPHPQPLRPLRPLLPTACTVRKNSLSGLATVRRNNAGPQARTGFSVAPPLTRLSSQLLLLRND